MKQCISVSQLNYINVSSYNKVIEQILQSYSLIRLKAKSIKTILAYLQCCC